MPSLESSSLRGKSPGSDTVSSASPHGHTSLNDVSGRLQGQAQANSQTNMPWRQKRPPKLAISLWPAVQTQMNRNPVPDTTSLGCPGRTVPLACHQYLNPLMTDLLCILSGWRHNRQLAIAFGRTAPTTRRKRPAIATIFCCRLLVFSCSQKLRRHVIFTRNLQHTLSRLTGCAHQRTFLAGKLVVQVRNKCGRG